MASLEFASNKIQDPNQIKKLLAEEGIIYQEWGVKDQVHDFADEAVLSAYSHEIEKLKEDFHYISADLVALNPDTPKLQEICSNFAKEHHHLDDEVRFVVEGEGVFEILSNKTKSMLKIKTQPGDLIIIPAARRHLFYLTASQNIRCIRLFKNSKGWEAIYSPATEQAESPGRI